MTAENPLNIAFEIEAKYRFPLAGAKIEFDRQSACTYIDIIHYTDSSSKLITSIHEGSVDDENLGSWMDWVGRDSTILCQILIIINRILSAHWEMFRKPTSTFRGPSWLVA
jgi:hypothetical protein